MIINRIGDASYNIRKGLNGKVHIVHYDRMKMYGKSKPLDEPDNFHGEDLFYQSEAMKTPRE